MLSYTQLMKYFLSILMAFTVLLIGAAGCGSDSSSAEPSLTKAQFVKRADAICTASENEQFKIGMTYLEEHPGVEEEEVIIPAGLPPIEKELRMIKDLTAPAGYAKKVDEFVQALEQAVTETRKDPGSALEPTGNPFEKPNNLAEADGLKGCAHNP
jgi:hypothetical protein